MHTATIRGQVRFPMWMFLVGVEDARVRTAPTDERGARRAIVGDGRAGVKPRAAGADQRAW
jgi:hypothetical protein